MEIRKDILGKTPMIGSIVCWNVPYCKKLICGRVLGFKPSGIAYTQIVSEHESRYAGKANKDGSYSVKYDFVIVEL